MQNQPITSGDHAKLFIFSILMLLSMVFLFGIIPVIILIFGIFMMKKYQDFTEIEKSVKTVKRYFYAILLGIAPLFFYNLNHIQYGISSYRYGFAHYFAKCISVVVIGLIAVFYLLIIHKLFYLPLSRHRKWVEVNGIFSIKPKNKNNSKNQSEIDIIKGEKLKQYSVADELIKWAKLKEDGCISEDEFNEVRAKLLKKN